MILKVFLYTHILLIVTAYLCLNFQLNVAITLSVTFHTCTACVEAELLFRKGKRTCSRPHPIHHRGHLHIREGHPGHRFRGETQRKRMCVNSFVCVFVSACKSSLVHRPGNSCRQDFLCCTGNKMVEYWRPGTMLWKSATTQVRGWGACESESRGVSRARPIAISWITCLSIWPLWKIQSSLFFFIAGTL